MVKVCMFCNLPLQGHQEIIEGSFACKDCADNHKDHDLIGLHRTDLRGRNE